MTTPDPAWMAAKWARTREWHTHQRMLPLKIKIKKLIELQHRQMLINDSKVQMGLVPVPMRVWQTRP